MGWSPEVSDLIFAVSGLVIGSCAGYRYKYIINKSARQQAGDITNNAEREAKNIIKEAQVIAKEERLKAIEDFEKATKQQRLEGQKQEKRLLVREENLENKSSSLDKRQAEIDRRDEKLRKLLDENRSVAEKLEVLTLKQEKELERIAGLSREEAKKQLLDVLENSLEYESAMMIRRFQDETKQRLVRDAQDIMVTAMQRYAGDCAYERTTSIIPLPNEEMKGRIIGREGRNIRAIEAATGVSVLIDDTPEAVVVSCFDPVRREIARIALERLVSDGRIHPTRIEDVVAKVKTEIQNEIIDTGQDAIDRLGLTNVRKNIIALVGRLKYRYSYSQNVLQHSLEVAYLMGDIAAQLGLDEHVSRRAGLFHDIGKAVDHEIEGSHAIIGMDLLKRAGESAQLVNAVGAHHEDVEKSTLMAVLVEICDTISAGRPGARCETTELYLKRLEQLENIGSEFNGVETCYAIQAGRELRVVVEPQNINEQQAIILAKKMANRIEKEMRYPGQIRVTIIRETRAVEFAK